MKRLLLLAVLIFSGVFVFAQEEDTDLSMTEMIFIQEAESGSFEMNEDDTYTLTLMGWGTEVSYIQSAPGLDSGFSPAAILFTGWVSAEDLVAEDAILRIGEETITLSLSNPTYDPVEGTVSYVAVIEEASMLDSSAKDPALPESFEEATLYIVTDGDFALSLDTGMTNAGLRGPKKPG